jgi:hypothetical protein
LDPETFAEWFRRQGKRVACTESTYWVESGPRAYQAFPYHWTVDPPAEELSQVFMDSRALGLRYSLPSGSPGGAASYHVVFTAHQYPLDALGKKARHDVSKGLEVLRVEPLPLHRLAAEGWEMRAETLARQGRMRAESQATWRRMCESAADLPGFESWAAYNNHLPVASLITFTCGDCCSILYQQSQTSHLRFRVNHALLYVFTNAVLSRPGELWIFYGLQSLDASPSVDQFKFRMGYQAKPVRQRVEFSPRLKFIITPASHKLVAWLHRSLPADARLAKVEGMLRFYLQCKVHGG